MPWRRRTRREVDQVAMTAREQEARGPRQPRRAPASDRVVAVILGDGTVREVDRAGRAVSEGPPWVSGSVSGPNWTLWWQRRTWEDTEA
jgi:hypothetical protein